MADLMTVTAMTVVVIHIGVCTRAAGIGTDFNLYGLIRRTFEFQGYGEFCARFQRLFQTH